MPNQNLNQKTIISIICLSLIGIGAAYSFSIVVSAMRVTKTIDEKIAKSSSVVINKTTLEKAMEILSAQKEPVSEQFWMEFDQASPSGSITQ